MTNEELDTRLEILEATIKAVCDALTTESGTQCSYTMLRNKIELEILERKERQKRNGG